MEEIHTICRPLERRDHTAVEEIIRRTWSYDALCERPRTAKLLARAFLQGCLVEHTYAQVAERDGRVVGAILARSDAAGRRHLRRRLGLAGTSLALLLSRDGRRVGRLYGNVGRVDRELLEKSPARFDGELVFFALEPEARGLGIGKALFERARAYLYAADVERFFLYTDTSCNWPFYERRGLERAGEKRMPMPGKEDFTFFLYQYSFA